MRRPTVNDIVLLLALAGALVAHAPIAASAQDRGPAEALDGLDPVLLVKGQEVFGKPEIAVTRGRFAYTFATPETRAEFERNPAAYEIQLGGLCARMGGTAGADGNRFAVHEGRIYAFGSDECRKRFIAAPARYLAPEIPALPTSPDAARRASALIARAVDALGGATALDGITTYVETATITDQRQMGPVTITQVTSYRFPDAARIDRTMTMSDGQRTFSTISTKTDAFFAGQGRVYPMPEAARPNLAIELARHPVLLLRARRDPQFKAAALGSGTDAASTGAATASGVALVAVRVNGVAATLGIDAQTGRVVSLSYVDRDSEGAYGTILVRYSDFRSVGALTLPFAREGSADGRAQSSLSPTLTSIDVNRPLDASLFQRPAETPRPPGAGAGAGSGAGAAQVQP